MPLPTQTNEKNYPLYWGYKGHVLVDCISGLPVCDMATAADATDYSTALDLIARADAVLPLSDMHLYRGQGL